MHCPKSKVELLNAISSSNCYLEIIRKNYDEFTRFSLLIVIPGMKKKETLDSGPWEFSTCFVQKATEL